MKTSQTFFYNEENGNIQYLDKRGFIGELCIVISKKDKNILCLDEIKKIYNLSYKDIVKKFEKVFKKLDNNIYGLKVQSKLGLICLIDKSTEDFEKYCKKNKLKFGQEVSNINKKNLFTKEGKCDIINYRPKESKEELKKMNKKLVKRVAVASLAALMTIPSLTTPINNSNIVYAGVAETTQKNIKHAQEMIEKFKKEGNAEGVKNWTKNLERLQNNSSLNTAIQEEAQRRAENAQKAAQAQAVQAEKDRIANTVYPLTAKYVKDFVPAVNDYQPHFYERPELPGVIFTLQQDSFGKLVDIKPNIKITEMPDYYRETNANGNKELLYTDTCQVIKVSYISPFNFAGKVSLGDFGLHSDLNNAALMAGWCHWIGENMEVQYDKTVNMHYKSGWPESYIGKQVNEITEANAIQPYGWYPTVTFRRKSIEEIKASARVYFSADEKVDSIGTSYKYINEHLGSSWVDTQDIYSVAREHGTD